MDRISREEVFTRLLHGQRDAGDRLYQQWLTLLISSIRGRHEDLARYIASYLEDIFELLKRNHTAQRALHPTIWSSLLAIRSITRNLQAEVSR